MSDWRSNFTNSTRRSHQEKCNNQENYKQLSKEKTKKKTKKRNIKNMLERFVLDISFTTTNGNMLERIKDFSVSFSTKTGKHKTDEDIVIQRTRDLIEEEYLQDGSYSIIDFDYEIIDYHRWEVS